MEGNEIEVFLHPLPKHRVREHIARYIAILGCGKIPNAFYVLQNHLLCGR